ncbi:hypothetical protein LY76DRAFT_588596 [Colletotrichum caudatum]|nr:hypothetical protein LY76DRAFT_588596 [Colletotrichum caudatum]
MLCLQRRHAACSLMISAAGTLDTYLPTQPASCPYRTEPSAKYRPVLVDFLQVQSNWDCISCPDIWWTRPSQLHAAVMAPSVLIRRYVSLGAAGSMASKGMNPTPA